MNDSPESDHRNGLEIAIIGMVGRFPGAKNIDEFWQNLQNGVESVSFFSESNCTSGSLSCGAKRPLAISACRIRFTSSPSTSRVNGTPF